MAISKALTFIRQARFDDSLRERCHTFTSRHILLDELGFTDEEFEEAFRSQLVKCQTEDLAGELFEFRFWFLMLGGETVQKNSLKKETSR